MQEEKSQGTPKKQLQAAAIVPQPNLLLTDKAQIHMCLAHLMGREGFENYTDFYRRKKEQGSFVIMDNGVVEGSPVTADHIIELVDMYSPSEIVLPDVMKDKKATLRAIDNFLHKIENPHWNTNTRFMAVPQGKDMEEWLDCAEQIISWDKVHTIGVPKWLVPVEGVNARALALRMLAGRVDVSKYEFHFLGCWRSPLEILTAAKFAKQGDIPFIRSVDSMIPYYFAKEGLKLSDDDREHNKALSNEEFQNGCSLDEALLQYNIDRWLEIGDLSPTKDVHYL